MNAQATLSPAALDLDTLEATARAAHEIAPGPWAWRGNTDFDDPQLSCWKPGLGRAEVLSHVPVERTADSVEGRNWRESLEDCGYTGQELEDAMNEWLFHNPEDDEDYRSPRTDPRLAFLNEHDFRKPAKDLVTYEVARHRGLPNDTPRSDSRIYRGEIVDVRSPLAQHLAAASPEVVLSLIARIRELEAEVAQ